MAHTKFTRASTARVRVRMRAHSVSRVPVAGSVRMAGPSARVSMVCIVVMKAPRYHPGIRLAQGPLGHRVDWIGPWGDARPLTEPCPTEEDALAALDTLEGDPLPWARRRGKVR